METTHVTLDRSEADRLWRKYKEHKAYSAPIDWEIQRAYQLLAKGKLIIRALESVTRAGVNNEGLPKLAIAVAAAKTCHLNRMRDGGCTMSDDQWRRRKTRVFSWRIDSFKFPAESFPLRWDRKGYASQSDHKAQVPLIPIDVRPKRGLQNYHILWEAEWRPEPPRDPYLLRRIGKADLWLVVAHWDLTEVERAALVTRIIQ